MADEYEFYVQARLPYLLDLTVYVGEVLDCEQIDSAMFL